MQYRSTFSTIWYKTKTTVPRLVIFACWAWFVSILFLSSFDSTWENVVRPHICVPVAKHIFRHENKDIEVSYSFVLATAPLLVVASLASLIVTTDSKDNNSAERRIQNQLFRTTDLGSGSIHFYTTWCLNRMQRIKTGLQIDGDVIAALFVVFPLGMYFASVAAGMGEGVGLRRSMIILSNTAGFGALLAMSNFLIVSVIRYNYIVDAIGGHWWPPTKAVRVHVWAGLVAILGSTFHGLVYLLDWLFVDKEGIGFWNYFIPPPRCFEPFWTQGERQIDKDNGITCSIVQRNFTGVMGTVALVILGLSSMNWIRRRSYRVFYALHVFCTPVILLMIALHGHAFFLYLAPALILWSSTTLPVLLDSFWCRGPADLVRVDTIASSSEDRPIHILTFQVTGRELDHQVQAGHYLQLRVPTLSHLAHPFSIVSMPTERKDTSSSTTHTYCLRIIFRSVGPFTTNLGKYIRSGTNTAPVVIPRVRIELPYGTALLPRILVYEKVKLVAGGVGITAFLSLLQEFVLHNEVTNCGKQELEMHWFCRDENLIKYICKEYAFHKLAHIVGDNLSIKVYNTGQALSVQDEDILYTGVRLEVGSDYSSLGESKTTIRLENPHHTGSEGSSPYTSSAIASGSCLYENTRRFMLLALNSLLGLSITYVVYNNFQDRQKVWSRLFAPFLVVIQEFIVALLFVTLNEKYPILLRNRWESVPMEDPKVGDTTPRTTESSDVDDHASRSQRHRFEIRHGRVPFVDILDRNTDAVFFCGPNAMYRSLRDIADGIPVYKEEFEL